MKPKSSCLIVAEDSPESYSPAGERLRHMALASGSLFNNTVVLTMGKPKRPDVKGAESAALLYTTGFTRSTPFPISALLDPIRLLAFLIYEIVLSARYKPSYIVASMPPIETGMSGLLLTKLLRKRLVIDYMDDWESSMSSQLTRYIPKTLMKPAFKFAGMIYSSSTVMFVATSTLVRTIRKRRIKTPVLLVPNGANSLLFSPRDEKSRREIRLKCALPLGKTVVAYCGSGMNSYYRLDLILLAAKSLSPVAQKRIFFVFYLYSGIEYYRKLKDALNIPDDLAEIREPLPRSGLSEVMCACDIGLVPFDDKPFLLYATSTKVYEYLSAGLFVIGSGPSGGELDSFFSRNTNCGVFVKPGIRDFVSVFLRTLQDNEGFLEDTTRNFRHSFVSENYNVKKIMTKAMLNLSSEA